MPQSNQEPMETKLRRISEVASRNTQEQFTNLVHLLNRNNLKECFCMLKRKSAVGVDGISWEEYGSNLEANLEDLEKRLKQQSYKPQPVQRVYIEKSNGKLRPLGIPCIEDKIVQMCIRRILEAIYEEDFLSFSYGFRRNRSCHMALDHLDKVIMREPINHVIDADIKGFFDNLSHEWLKKFLEVRIKDRSLLRIIVRFLKSGIMEDLKTYETEKGTPQGGVISPVLANLYLHYVLDLWVEKVIKRRYLGAVEIVRYADDFVICVRQKDEAIRLLDEMKERFEMFGLELAEEKTRLIEFGRYAETNARKNGRSPDTFDFLGFTHYCSKSRNGRFMVKRKTARKKLCVKINETYQWLKDIRNQVKVREWWSIVAAKLRGHYQYYGVSGNFRCLKSFYWLVVRAVFKWLNRRSQKKSMNWNQFREYLVRFPLPKPRITYNMYTLCS